MKVDVKPFTVIVLYAIPIGVENSYLSISDN